MLHGRGLAPDAVPLHAIGERPLQDLSEEPPVGADRQLTWARPISACRRV